MKSAPYATTLGSIKALVHGLYISMGQFLRKPVTIQYPEEHGAIDPRFRGEHALTKDEHGHMKCVACYMCATACPAECIHIEAQPAPEGKGWEGRDKIPRSFDIDMLRCIYCGFCVEACPKDAIMMTNKIPVVHDNRKDFIYGIDKLLGHYDEFGRELHKEQLREREAIRERH
ncbi:MAG: NADH-quinone oxidoreductase subunit I [Spirochaetia bacterium]|nr:NADH-quinone oxidoreductase subunit I [Spirochaetia bacterium]